jgi:hypothetical protein
MRGHEIRTTISMVRADAGVRGEFDGWDRQVPFTRVEEPCVRQAKLMYASNLQGRHILYHHRYKISTNDYDV